jgi:hypothetical protein
MSNIEISDSIEQMNFIHSLFQELENGGLELPMGDYNLVYKYLEDARAILEEYEEEIDSQFGGE